MLTALQAKAESAKRNLAASVKTLAQLSELCSRYALAHESVFEKKRLVANQQGVRTGDVVQGDATYHFASGYDGYVRNTPDKLTQDWTSGDEIEFSALRDPEKADDYEPEKVSVTCIVP